MSLNFSISELCHSDIATQYKIENKPSIAICDNLLNLIFYVLQPLRDKLGKPIIVTSGYRSKQLNAHPKIKGAANSGHLRGTCADIVVKGISAKELLDIIVKSNIKFTQLIEEYNNNTSWVHIEYDIKNLKNEKLKYINGRYIKIY